MLSRIAFNSIVRSTRANPITRTIAPYRWQSTQSASSQGGSNTTAVVAGGLAVLVGGLAWYQLSGTRQLVNTAQAGAKTAQELKEKVKDKAGDPESTLKYLRSASASLIPGSAPFLGKIFDQVEEIAKEHGDDVKKIFQETYKDLEKLVQQGNLDPKTANQAVDIIQKHVKQIQDLAGDAGSNTFNKLLSENPELRDKVSKSYDEFKGIVQKAKDKKPEAQQLLKETGNELADLFKSGDLGKKNVQKALDVLKKKGEEAKKLVEDIKQK